MLQIGKLNSLEILGRTEAGLYLDGIEHGDLLLPRRFSQRDAQIGEFLEVFPYYDSEDRLTVTTVHPHAGVGEFAHLKVTSLSPVGAFLDWGLPKDLLLPFREQTRPLSVGHKVIVFIYLDSSGRISASMRTDKYADHTPGNYREGQSVDLMIVSRTDLGYKAIINGRHIGILYANEVFQPLEHGERLTGFIKKLREDGKIDLSLMQTGHRDSENIEQKILNLLDREEGFLPVDDKTSPEVIYNVFGVSKKKYKMALGGLLKKRLIAFEGGGIKAKPGDGGF